MLFYVDIDGTICTNTNGKYETAAPYTENTIIYWTARGSVTGMDWTDLTTKQLKEWGASYHELKMNSKPHYDLLICDKTKRIEEI